MEFLKIVAILILALCLGAMLIMAMPILYMLGIGLLVIGIAYCVYALKDFDPTKHNPFKPDDDQ